jgi:heterotetrameric sarcosine oxidase beta subunit
MRYSGLKVITEGLFGNKGWKPAWREPDPKPEYDVVIIGGGGHGLSTAFYLAKNHGITNVAVLEKGYLGGGNVGRNTTIVRANYFLPGNQEFYSHSMKLWEGMESELNYNVMHSQRGLINLFHSDGQRDAFARRGNAMLNQGDDADFWTAKGCGGIFPISISNRPASRSMAGSCTDAAARPAMTRWPGAMRAVPTCAASI